MFPRHHSRGARSRPRTPVRPPLKLHPQDRVTATRGTRAALFVALALSSAACMDAASQRVPRTSLVQQLTSATEAQAQTPTPAAAPRAAHPRDPAPAVIRGIYVNAYAAGNPITRAKLVALTDSTE